MKNYSFILLLFFVGLAQAQSEDQKIAWTENSRLTWEDFREVSPEESLFHANTNTGFSYSWGLKGTSERMELVYKVETFFYPEQSWVQPTSKSEYLLKHEQLHFDISELHARKLRKMLSNVDSSKLNKDSQSYLSKLYENVDKERSNMQNAFDADSNHSLNTQAELKWQAYIEVELKRHNQYIN